MQHTENANSTGRQLKKRSKTNQGHCPSWLAIRDDSQWETHIYKSQILADHFIPDPLPILSTNWAGNGSSWKFISMPIFVVYVLPYFGLKS